MGFLKKALGAEKKSFRNYNELTPYGEPEPSPWKIDAGQERVFTLQGATLKFDSRLDTCMRSYSLFEEAAKYYTEQFKFKYACCAVDYDSFKHYFHDLYQEGLNAMIERSQGICFACGVFDVEKKLIEELHADGTRNADVILDELFSKENSRKALGKSAGALAEWHYGTSNQVGAVFANERSNLASEKRKAEIGNAIYGLTGKFASKVAENICTLSEEEKTQIWNGFEPSRLFAAVYSDYKNVFYCVRTILMRKNAFGKTTGMSSDASKGLYENMQNAMFPMEMFWPNIVNLLEENPFNSNYYDLIESKIGKTEEVDLMRNYFGIGAI